MVPDEFIHKIKITSFIDLLKSGNVRNEWTKSKE